MVLRILKILGKIALILLLVILALLLLLLFFPFTYRACVRAEQGKSAAEARLSWLFGAIRADATLPAGEKGKRVDVSFRVFGIPVLKLTQKRREKKQKQIRVAAQVRKRPTVSPASARGEFAGEKSGADIPIEIVKRKRPGFLVRLGARISAIIGKIKEIIHNFADWMAFLASEPFSRGVRVIRRQGLGILRHIKPNKIKGRLAFGFEDPYRTGQALGILSVLYPVLPKGLDVEPNFQGKELEADVRASGFFFGIVLLVRGLKIWTNRDVRTLMKRFRGRGAAGKQEGNVRQEL